jgi:hypothetical protein
MLDRICFTWSGPLPSPLFVIVILPAASAIRGVIPVHDRNALPGEARR